MQTHVVPRSIVAALALLITPPLHAQPDTAGTPGVAAPRRSVCWRPRAEQRCRGYLVTEFAVERAVLSSTDDLDVRFVGTLGPMINRGPGQAWGLLISVSTDDPDEISPLRIEARYRKWLGSTSGVDLGLGLTRHSAYYLDGGNFGAESEAQLQGLTASVGIEQGLLGVGARVDLMRGGGQSERAVFVGVRAGGYTGPLAAAALVVGFYGLLMIAYSGA